MSTVTIAGALSNVYLIVTSSDGSRLWVMEAEMISDCSRYEAGDNQYGGRDKWPCPPKNNYLAISKQIAKKAVYPERQSRELLRSKSR